MEDKLSAVPNAFYDLIVFASSTVLLAVGILTGVGQLQGKWFNQLNTGNVVLILAALLFFSYEYGRIAEAWSSVIVQRPLRFIRDHTKLLSSDDFLAPLDNAEHALGLSDLHINRNGGKWVVYSYAMNVDSKLGADLLKRYAWEKLSRNSAFTFCVLTIFSLSYAVMHKIASVNIPWNGHWTFGTIRYTTVLSLMTLITYYEYYLRNCWNNDLLQKVLPVLARAASRTDTPDIAKK